MHSSVNTNIFKMSFSMLNKVYGVFIAIEHIDLSDVVMRRLTLLCGDLYRITFWENLTALVSSYLSIWKSGEFRRPWMVGLFLESMSRQLATKSNIKPSSFFLSRTFAFANV